MARRVVVTGIGIWSCLGTDQQIVTQNLREGKSGIGLDNKRLEYGYRSALTGIVKRPELKPLLKRRLRLDLAEQGEYAYMAAREAFGQSGITQEYLDTHEVGTLFGNDTSARPVIQTARMMEKIHDSELLGSELVFQSLNSTVTMNLSTIFHLRGINCTISSACASGSHAIGMGYLFIQQGLQDCILCGGAQEVNYEAMSSFDALRTFSMRMKEPSKASRPFDRDRDGLVPSGGAAALILEDYAHAVKRGAPILAEITGYGFSSNGGNISQPNKEGCAIAMNRAIKAASIRADDIDYINAHATSTPQGDQVEAQALDEIFHGTHAWISSTKGMTGHECWMAGASEIVYSILMMQQHFIAPNINCDNRDEYSEPLHLATETKEADIKYLLSNSFGFGGTNSALVLKKYEL